MCCYAARAGCPTAGARSDMSNDAVLPSSEVNAYRENGYLAVEGLVSPPEIQELKAEATRLCRGVYPIPGVEPAGEGEPDEESLRRYLCIHQVHKVSPVMRRYAAHPGIAAVLARLIG